MKIIALELLYWGAGKRKVYTGELPHHHDYFQLEFCWQGQMICQCMNKQKIRVNSGEAIFIPMGQPHLFIPYKDKESVYFSFKFRLPGEGLPENICKLPKDFFTMVVGENLKNILLPENQTVSQKIADPKELFTMLIAGLLDHWFSNHNEDFCQQGILQFIRKKTYQFGAGVTLKELAQGMNLTVHGLRYRFRKAMQNLPPEAVNYHNPADFIAAELLLIAKTHLQTSSLPVGDVAAMLKFNNIYAFSRFFKKHTGVSPQKYRRMMLNGK